MVSHHPDGFLRMWAAGLLHPAISYGLRRVSECPGPCEQVSIATLSALRPTLRSVSLTNSRCRVTTTRVPSCRSARSPGPVSRSLCALANQAPSEPKFIVTVPEFHTQSSLLFWPSSLEKRCASFKSPPVPVSRFLLRLPAVDSMNRSSCVHARFTTI